MGSAYDRVSGDRVSGCEGASRPIRLAKAECPALLAIKLICASAGRICHPRGLFWHKVVHNIRRRYPRGSGAAAVRFSREAGCRRPRLGFMIVTYNRLGVPRKPVITLPGAPNLAKIWPTMNGACQPARAQALTVPIREGRRPVRTASVRIFRLTGTLETPGPIWEERLARPIDIHHAHRSRDDHVFVHL